jgi:hypothetical protein
VYITIKRKSESYDTLPVIVSDRIIDTLIDMRNFHVEIQGQYRSRNVHEDGKNHLELYVWAETLTLSDKCYENEIMLDGYVCTLPTFRRTPLGRTISDTIIAVDRRISKSDYLPVISWSRNAAYLSRLNAGTKVTIKGRIQSRNYIKRFDENNYEERVAYEVSVLTIGSCEYAESTNTTKEILQ